MTVNDSDTLVDISLTKRRLSPGWLRIKYPTRQCAISPLPVVWF